jgi:hypothetical protein
VFQRILRCFLSYIVFCEICDCIIWSNSQWRTASNSADICELDINKYKYEEFLTTQCLVISIGDRLLDQAFCAIGFRFWNLGIVPLVNMVLRKKSIDKVELVK